ncbi:hypothetical protein [uncultured Kordia sp.]|uniref:hypothetical protein n=1 Tax=uncultured Kordia sp. TaxID=507699 RepID=UPI0026160E38|nr:hypothetical protein [uncultured Kordia sp.]
MKVINIHTRTIKVSKDKLLPLFATLSEKDDRIWPKEKWPSMRFKKGLVKNAEGGHGPVRYKVLEHDANGHVVFEFQKPTGFIGTHSFEITALDTNSTEIKHMISMKTKGFATLLWIFAIRWLHDALLEDAFDKVENYVTHSNKTTTWNLWVKILRKLLK